MVSHKTQLTALVLVWVMWEAAQKDIMMATAAYVAVLVVFVGAKG